MRLPWGGSKPETRPGPGHLRGSARTGRRSSQEPSFPGIPLSRNPPFQESPFPGILLPGQYPLEENPVPRGQKAAGSRATRGRTTRVGQGRRSRAKATWQKASRLSFSIGDRGPVHSSHTRMRAWRRSARRTGRRSEKREDREEEVNACGHETVAVAGPVPTVGFGVGTGAKTASPPT